MAGAGGALGIATPVGAGLAAAGVLYLAIDLAILQRRLERRMIAAGGSERAAQEFLQRALALGSVEEVAQEFGRAVTSALGPTRAVLVAPGGDGGVRVLVASGSLGPGAELGDATPAFLWLGDRAEPLQRDQLEELTELDGARATAELLDTLGCDLLLPLRHRGLLLGLGLIALPARSARADDFFRAMRAYTTVAFANTFLHAEARDDAQLASTFDLATAMQESLMPDERPVRRNDYELRGLFRPVDACGGDLWHWRELRGGKVLLVIADATGHGAAPALLAAVAKGAIDATWQLRIDGLDPGALLSAMNTAVHRTGRKRYMMTAFAAVVDPAAGEMRYANAGQNFPIFIHGPSSETPEKLEHLIARGNSLGAVSTASFETHRRPIAVGDKLILYTDGLVEAGSPEGEPWGEKRFRAALAALADQRATRIPELIMAEVDLFLGGRSVSDDITMVAFQLGVEGAP